MTLPPTVTEDEFLRQTAHIAKVLAKQFGSVHGSPEDFAQEVVVWSLQALPKYDPARPLGPFLYKNARNRAMNAIRDRVTRTDPPCSACHEGKPCGANGTVCKKYAGWLKRNTSKSNLHRALPLSDMDGADGRLVGRSSPAEDEAADQDLLDFIDLHLPLELRRDYLMLLAGERVLATDRRVAVRREVAAILAQAGVEVDAEGLGFDPRTWKRRKTEGPYSPAEDDSERSRMVKPDPDDQNDWNPDVLPGEKNSGC